MKMKTLSTLVLLKLDMDLLLSVELLSEPGRNLTKTSGLLVHHIYYRPNVLSNRYLHGYDLIAFGLSQSLRASYSASVGKIRLLNSHNHKFQVSGTVTNKSSFSHSKLSYITHFPMYENTKEIS